MITLLPLTSTLISLGLAFFAWRFRHRYRWVFSFALLSFAVSEWSLGYFFELTAVSLETKIIWAKIEYLGIVLTPLLWFIFSWQYVSRDQWLTRKRLLLLLIVPALTFLFVITNEWHGLIWQETSLIMTSTMRMLEVSYGFWFWLHSAYSYLLLLVGSIVLLRAFRRFATIHRWQIGVLLLGPLAPWIGNIVYLTGVSPIPNFDLTPLAFTISGVVFAWDVFRLNLLDLVPIARRALIDSMSDAMLVVDVENRIVDVNEAFALLVGQSEKELVGQSIKALFTDQPEWARAYNVTDQHEDYDWQDLEVNGRYYDARTSMLFNDQQQPRGRLIILRDITERREMEQELLAEKQLSVNLLEATWVITQELDLDVVLHNAVRTAVNLTHAENGNLILLNNNNQIFRSLLAHKDGKEIIQRDHDVHQIVADGLAGWVIRQRRSALVSETTQDERWIQVANGSTMTHSALAVPILERSQAIGVLTVTHPKSQHFTQQDELFLQAATNQLALALRNAQSFENQRQLAQNQATLYQILRAISGYLDPQTVLWQAAETIDELTNWPAHCLLITGQTGQSFALQAATGVLGQLSSNQFTADSGIWGRALRTSLPQVVSNVRQDPDFIGGYSALNSALALPMMRGSHLLGVLYIESDRPEGLNQDERWLADALAEAIGLAVDNAQTHDVLRQHAADLSTLYSITRLVSHVLMDENVLQQVLYLGVTALHCDMGLITLADPYSGGLTIAAQRSMPASFLTHLQDKGLENSICNHAHSGQETLYLPDVTDEQDAAVQQIRQLMPTAIDDLVQLGIKSYFGIPLHHHERPLGTLCLFANSVYQLSIEEMALHKTIGQQISLALANMNLYSQTNQQLKKQTALREAITAITSSLDLPTVLSQIAEQMSRALDSTSAYICSYDSRLLTSEVLAEYMGPEANDSERESDLGVVYQLDQEFPYDLTSLAEGAPTIIHDHDPDLMSPERQHMLDYGAKSILVIPLRAGGQTIAYAELWESRQYRHFTAEEIEIAQIMAGQAAIAMENVGLFASITDERGRLDALIQSSRDGVVLVSMDRRVLVVNERALQFFDLTGTPQDWVNRPLRKVLDSMQAKFPQVVAVTLEEIQRIRDGDEPESSGEYEVGSRVVRWLNLPVLSDRKAIGRLLVLRDITEEKLLARMRDDLTHTMVHDLRNPLASISLSLDMLKQQYGFADNPAANLVLGRARNSTDRVLAMVNAILDISRLESGRMPVEAEQVLVPELVSDLLRVQMPLAHQKNIRLVGDIPTDAVVWADKNLIERVLQNLIGNALKFTPEDGLVTVKAVQKQSDHGLRLHLSVQDSGSGIPLEMKEHLFQKFATGSQEQRGSGLGLAFCKMAIEAHGEQIWLESSSEAGTVFTFTLPLSPDE